MEKRDVKRRGRWLNISSNCPFECRPFPVFFGRFLPVVLFLVLVVMVAVVVVVVVRVRVALVSTNRVGGN